MSRMLARIRHKTSIHGIPTAASHETCLQTDHQIISLATSTCDLVLERRSETHLVKPIALQFFPESNFRTALLRKIA